MRSIYRVIESTNTKTRRLAYLSAIVSLIRDDAFTERGLIEKLNNWGKENSSYYNGYWVRTGEITSTDKNSAGMRYIELAKKLGLITSIAGMYRATRIGLLLLSLIRKYKITQARNPFFINPQEKLFFVHLLLKNDADILLTIIDELKKYKNSQLSKIQTNFFNTYLDRLKNKTITLEDEIYKRQILERRNALIQKRKNPARYSEHIVPPRLNWLFDLELLEVSPFLKHKYSLSIKGDSFFTSIPQVKDNLIDVSDEWLGDTFWTEYANIFINTKPHLSWEQLDDSSRTKLIEGELKDVFSYFQYSQIPRVSISQAMSYLTIVLITSKNLVVSPAQLTNWFSTPRLILDKKYEIRLSPRENESYLLASLT